MLALTAHAPGTDWGAPGRESAVATLSVDGRYSQDVVLFEGGRRFTYRVALGRLERGTHRVRVRFNREKSTGGARRIIVDRLKARATSGTARFYRHSPILYGRATSRAYENNRTDTPLVEYHTITAGPNGERTIEYSVIWSNEDLGTGTPALMARWGRTTDIEWVYRVRLDRHERRLGEWYQDAFHRAHPFTGLHRGGHPLLETTSGNNGVRPVGDTSLTSGYRFFLDPASRLRARRPRRHEMDAHPWTYEVSWREIAREHRAERRGSPTTRAVSDPRNYLLVDLPKVGTVPTAVAVRLKGGTTWFRSDHESRALAIGGNHAVSTAVELPPGTAADDVAEIRAVADAGDGTAPGWRVAIHGTVRAFFLGRSYLPLRAFHRRGVRDDLTADAPSARI